MTILLVSTQFAQTHGAEIRNIAAEAGMTCDLLLLPEDPDARLTPEQCATADIAFFSGDIFPTFSRSFFSATQSAANLRWLHVFHAGVDNPVFQRLLERGVRISTSSGSTAKPIAQTAIGGMLMLARGFPAWGEQQRQHAWEPVSPVDAPPDLDGQTLVVFGVGAIGDEIARLAQAIGLHVIGIRRSPKRDADHVNEMYPPSALRDVLPRADWLAMACPLTNETRGIVDAEAIAQMPRGSRVINIARGEVIDEPAMIAALQSGHLGGAYLDVFATEPLPPESPLWDLPNVIVTPHNSSVATGNAARTVQYFMRNLRAWGRGEPLENEVRP